MALNMYGDPKYNILCTTLDAPRIAAGGWQLGTIIEIYFLWCFQILVLDFQELVGFLVARICTFLLIILHQSCYMYDKWVLHVWEILPWSRERAPSPYIWRVKVYSKSTHLIIEASLHDKQSALLESWLQALCNLRKKTLHACYTSPMVIARLLCIDIAIFAALC